MGAVGPRTAADCPLASPCWSIGTPPTTPLPPLEAKPGWWWWTRGGTPAPACKGKVLLLLPAAVLVPPPAAAEAVVGLWKRDPGLCWKMAEEDEEAEAAS